jgi:hypothetical protein
VITNYKLRIRGLLFYFINSSIFLKELKNKARSTLVMIRDFPDTYAKTGALMHEVNFVAMQTAPSVKTFFQKKHRGPRW